MFFYNKFTLKILSFYKNHFELIDSIPIGFTGVATERPAPVFSNDTSSDMLYFAAHVNFTNTEALVRIRSLSPQYDWMANISPTPQDTPITAVAGVSTQALPVLPFVQPFFVKAKGRLQLNFTNGTAAPVTGGIWTFRLLKLVEPINGTGWDYSIGML